MHDQLITNVSHLPEYDQLELLRKMIEGTLSYNTLALSVNNLHKMLHYSEPAREINELIQLFKSFHEEKNDSKAAKLFAEYSKLSMKDRMKNSSQYQTKIILYEGIDSEVLKALEKKKSQDDMVILAVRVLEGLFAKSVYCIPSVKTSELINLFNQLKSNPAAPYETNNPDLDVAVRRFQFFYDILTHSYIPSDTKECINIFVCGFLDREAKYRVPINKTFSVLTKLKDEIQRTDFSKFKLTANFLNFSRKDPGYIFDLKCNVRKMPLELDIMDDDVDKEISIIAGIFYRTYDIITKEQPSSLLKSSDMNEFFKKYLDEMTLVCKEESASLIVYTANSLKAVNH